jgi:hypothetical protein
MPEQSEQRPRGPMVKLLSLWENKSAGGKRYWSTWLSSGVKVLMFRNKSDHPQAPTFDIFIAQESRKPKGSGKSRAKEDTDDYSSQPQDTAKSDTPSEAEAPAEGDEELPF